MNLKKFSAVNLQRCVAPDGFDHPLSAWSEAEWSNAMAGEVGEACNLTKKIIRHRDGTSGNVKPEDKDLLSLRLRAAKEVADAMIYGDLLIQKLGFDTSEVLEEVFNQKSIDLDCPIWYEE